MAMLKWFRQLQELKESNAKLYQLAMKMSQDLMAAHTKNFLVENRLWHAKKYAEDLVAAHRAEVVALQQSAAVEKERVLGLVDLARRQAATEAKRGTFRVLEQLIIDISTGGKDGSKKVSD